VDAACVRDARNLAEDAQWRLLAVEYARSRGVQERRLVRGAPPGSRVDMSWYFFVAIGHGRVVLIDCGTDALSRPGRQGLRDRWSIASAVRVEEALGRVGLAPSDVTDIVLTHFHWDHVDGLGRFPGATVHAHGAEWRRVPARLREAVESEGRLRAVSGGERALWPGFVVREAGQHTPHQLMVQLSCATDPVVIAGDAAYLYRNIVEGRPVTISAASEQNVADVAQAVQAVGADHVIPGHDPALFDRYPSGVDAVAAICM